MTIKNVTVNNTTRTVMIAARGVQGPGGGGGGGSGDVTGPASSTDGNFAQFDGATGKLLKDGGAKPADFATAAQGTLAATALQPEAGLAALDASAASKLAGIAAGATANATDAQLRDRSTHTGTQPASTITGLAAVATSGAYADLTGKPTIPAAQVNSDWAAGSGVAQILNKPTLGDAAAKNTGTSAGTVAAGDDSRFTDAREWSAATVTQPQAEDDTNTTRYAWTPQRVWQAVRKWFTTVKDVANGVVGLDANSRTRPIDSQATGANTATPGGELATNGSMSGSLTGWTTGAGWAYGSNSAVWTIGSAAALSQTISVTGGARYLVKWTQQSSSGSNASITPSIGGTSGVPTAAGSTSALPQAQVITAPSSGSLTLAFTGTQYQGGTGTITITSVSVVQITPITPVMRWYDSSGSLRGEGVVGAGGILGVGTDAARNATTGPITGVGTNAARNATTGSVTGVGAYAARNATTGPITGVGVSAAYNATTGSVTGVGASAAYNATTGYVTGIGAYAAYNATTGSIVAIGNTAGRYTNAGSALQTNTNCVYVGDDSRSAADGSTYEIVIGTGGRGAGSYTTTIGASNQKYALINGAIVSGTSTVVSLPAASSVPVGAHYFATNGRKAGEASGSGTGVPVWSDGTNWKTYYDNTTVAA